MAGWMPWTMTEPDYIRMEIGGFMLRLERLQLGDGKTVERREQTFQDLVLHQSGRPLMRQLDMRFGGYKLWGDVEREWTFNRFIELMDKFPGWPVTLVWPDDTVHHGVVLDHTISEVSDEAGELAFTFSIMREYPQGEVMIA